jgi:Icc-related predicted phosphoesterase
MRIVAFGDLHMALGAWGTATAPETADLVVVTGDLTNFGHRREAQQMLEGIWKRHTGPLLALPGNLDHRDVGDYLSERGINLHGRGRLMNGGIGFFGLGGSNLTPFHTPLEFSEEELARFLAEGHHQVRSAAVQVLVSHVPPYGTQTDRLADGTHVGSPAVRDFIERLQPDLCLCGHIHESRGEDRLGKTRILNPGMIKDGGWIGVNIGKRGVTAGLELASLP